MLLRIFQESLLVDLNFIFISLGLLLRWFVNLYNLEIVEEDAFMRWKEDMPTQEFPGKGKALFQVSFFLM